MKNTIYLRRRLRVTVDQGQGCQSDQLIASLQKNLQGNGFLMSPELIERARTLDDVAFKNFGRSLMRDIKQMIGAHRPYNIMYPNFPDQVMGMDEARLYLNAILHYLTLELPACGKNQRPDLDQEALPKVIGLGSQHDFEGIFAQLVGSKTSLSQSDKDDVSWFVAQYREDIGRLIPPLIPAKETWAFLGSELIKKAPGAWRLISAQAGNATDILRLAVGLSGGDVSFAVPARFVAFDRRSRREILGSLEQMDNVIEDMMRWKERWKRLGEKLHPGDYRDRYVKACAAFAALRNNSPKVTFNSKVETLLEAKDVEAAAHLLSSRPGDFARRLDHLLRLSSSPEMVLQAFRGRAEKVSTPVLLQMLAHYRGRDDAKALRVFFPKGIVAKAFTKPSNLAALPPGIASQAAEICEKVLLARFAALPPMGRCYLDPALRDYMVPMAQRSASKALRTLARGSRVGLPAQPVLRFFIWWKNGKGRTDIDLSAAMFGGDFKHVSDIAFYNLRDSGGCHSGDIVDAPQGASEFIDISIPQLVCHKIRYVAMVITSYTEQPFCDLPECFAGWMARENPASGEVYEPKTVQDVVDISSDTRFCIPVIFDIAERKAIWTDLGIRNDPHASNTVILNEKRLKSMLRAMVELRKPDLFTLISLHIKARGTPVSSPQDANMVFSVGQGVTPFDLDTIRADYL